jgi:hypothetical protein
MSASMRGHGGGVPLNSLPIEAEPYVHRYTEHDRVIVGTREGRFIGVVVAVTPRTGTLAIQLPGWSEVVYRNPKHVKPATEESK